MHYIARGIAFKGLFLACVLTVALFCNTHVCLSYVGLRLAVYAVPPILPADGRSYKCIYVQIQDAEGRPVKAPSDVLVVLTSSNLEVGVVEESVVIPKGCDFAIARFNTSFVAGETAVTASSSGFETGKAVLKTVGKVFGSLSPYRLRVMVVPSAPPAVEGFKGMVSVQVVDRFNTPINVPLDTRVVLTSSNLSVLKAPDALVIAKGRSYAVAFFEVKGVVGSATLTALAQGFEPGNATVSVVRVGGEPTRLALTLTYQILPSDGGVHEDAIVVELLDGRGAPTPAKSDVKVNLASSNPEVAAVPGEVVVRRGCFYATIPVKAGFKEGAVVLAASSQGFEADAMTLEVRRPAGLEFKRLKLVVYVALPVVADGESKDVIVVQVQSDGYPVALTRNTTVYLSSSVDIGHIPPRMVIEAGETYAVAPFTPLSPGAANITASAQGLESSTAALKAILLPVDVTVEVPSRVELNQTYTVKLSVASLGLPLSGAVVDWTVVGGEAVSEANKTDLLGEASLTVKQTERVLTVLARVSKPGYESTVVSRRVEAVSPPTAPRPFEVELLGFRIQVLQLVIAVACVIAALALAYLYLKRMWRRSPPEMDMEEDQ